MKPSLLAPIVKAHIEEGTNAHIQGPPGVGKTVLVQDIVAEDPSLCLIQRHAPSMQPEDQGMPWKSADGEGLDFIPAKWMPLKKHAARFKDFRKIVVFIDELPQGDNHFQKFVANLMQEHEYQGYELMDNVSFITTGNRVADRAGAGRILSHLADRSAFYDYDVDLNDWCRWALSNGVPSWLVACMRFKPGLLHDFDPQRDKNSTPRGLTRLGKRLESGLFPSESELDIAKAEIGEGPAAEVIGFKRTYHKLPNINALLMNPDTCDLPTEPSIQYALSGALAHHAKEDNFDRVLRVASRMPPEFTLFVVRDACQREKSLFYHEAFIQWSVSNEGAIIT